MIACRVLRLATARMIQLAGNVLKLVFYLDIWLRPDKRYRIPPFAGPIFPGKQRAIPRVVWLTNYTDRVTLSVYVNYLFNRCIAPTHAFRFFGDAECSDFMESGPAGLAEAYRKLQIGAAKADLWRIAVLHRNGGIYLDMDATLSWSPELFLRADQRELFAQEKDGRLTNYFLAAAPAHPVLADIAARIVANISDGSLTSVYDMTGPTVIDDIARHAPVVIEPSRLFCRQGQFTKKEFQYPEKLAAYWAREQEKRPIVAPPADSRRE